MRHQFIQQEQRVYSPTLLCRVLQVSRSGYYASRQRVAQPKPVMEELALVAAVQRIAHATHATYGSRRMMHELQAGGHAVGRYRTRTLMKKAQVTVIRRRRWTTTTQSRHAHPIAPNHLARQFTVAAPNQVWAGDITYLWTQTGWLYLAVVMDLFSRKVVGVGIASDVGQCAGGRGPADGGRPAAAPTGPAAPFGSREPICWA